MSFDILRRACAGTLAASLMLTSLPGWAGEVPREGTCVDAQQRFPDNNPGPGSLKTVPVPQPTGLELFVKDRKAAIALGKALFWDMQVGSDGIQACASCHFQAGADPRSINQLNPGGLNNADQRVHLGLNRQLQHSDFPLHKLSDPTDRKSQVLRSVDDVVSSQGVKLSRFAGAERGAERDRVDPLFDAVFNIGGHNVRRNEPRNTPTVINAAYTRRQFWDVRSKNIFNGVNSLGVGDENARVLQAVGPNQIVEAKVRIDNASLANQAVEPPLSDREMSAVGRTFLDVGRRLASARVLKNQRIAWDDSVFGEYLSKNDRQNDDNEEGRKGLKLTYADLVKAAFQPAWWQSNLIIVQNGNTRTFRPLPNRSLRDNEYTLLEYNFALFFGLAVQLYEMTLISDDTPMDRYFDGNTSALNEQQLRGLEVFRGEAACSACHAGAETTNNSTRILLGTVVNGVQQPAEVVERMYNGNCEVVTYDQGVYNLAVRPTAEDLGIANLDPLGNPLSWIKLLTTPKNQIPSQELANSAIPNIANPPIYIGERTVTEGAFKVPTLRNIALTAPYFHNGGHATLRQAVEFYNRGGDFRELNSANIDFEIGKLNLTEQEIEDLVEFLRSALTDERVAKQKAPFDHPQLFVPNGHATRPNGDVIPDGRDGAKDVLVEIKAVGRNGDRGLKSFLER